MNELNYDKLLEMIHESSLQIKHLTDHQGFLAEKVDNLTSSVEKLVESQNNIHYLLGENEVFKTDFEKIKKRIKDLEEHTLIGNAWKRLFSQWWKFPIAATIFTAIFEAGKHGFHF